MFPLRGMFSRGSEDTGLVERVRELDGRCCIAVEEIRKIMMKKKAKLSPARPGKGGSRSCYAERKKKSNKKAL